MSKKESVCGKCKWWSNLRNKTHTILKGECCVPLPFWNNYSPFFVAADREAHCPCFDDTKKENKVHLDLAYIMTEIHSFAKLGSIPSKIIMDRGTWNSCVLMLTPTPYGLVQHETKGNMLCGLPVEIDDDKVDYFRVMCEPNKSGRSEGWSDVCAELRAILDPKDTHHWNKDGLLKEVKSIVDSRAAACDVRKEAK